MAKSKNYSVLEDVHAWLGRITFTFKGTDLSGEDSSLMRQLLGYQYALGCDLLPLSRMHHYRSWLASTAEIDVFSFGKFLGSVDEYIKNYLELYETTDSTGVRDLSSFKRSIPDVKGYWGFITPIAEELSSYFQQPEPSDLKVILQWINFIRRANLRDLDLSETLQNEYVEFEQEMQEWSYDPTVIRELNLIIRGWFGKSIEIDDFRPKHGPGSVADCKGRPDLVTKYSLMKKDLRLAYLAKYIGPISEYVPIPFLGKLDRTSEIVCVPKSMITNRTISKEPASLQYFQQGVMSLIMDYVEKHHYLGHRISFIDQTKSSGMALIGSILGEFSTVDLSSASDSVSLDLVKKAFRGTWLLPLLMCTRSDSTILPNGTKLRLNKFAPMGSAVCFPVETILFAACCEVAKRRCGDYSANYRVFGDDIVIKNELTEELLQVLEQCHFKVNTTKSFWGTTWLNFREACGGEYFNGVEVTPLRVSRKFRHSTRFTTQSAENISSYISFANEAFEKGYLQLRKEILGHLQSHAPNWLYDSLVYSEHGRIGITTFPDGCTNYKLKSRINRGLQKKEVKGHVPKSTRIPSCDDCPSKKILDDIEVYSCEDIRYFEWLRRSRYRDEEPRRVDGSLSICPAVAAMRGSWIGIDNL